IVLEKHPRLLGGLKDGLESVIVALRNRIEFVIVAAGAADAEAKKYRPRRVHPIDERLDAVDILDLVQHVAVGSDRVEASAGHRRRIVRIELVTADLLLHE